VKYAFYLEHYQRNYKCKFGRPSSDVCSACEEKQERKKERETKHTFIRQLTSEIKIHKQQAQFFTLKSKKQRNYQNLVRTLKQYVQTLSQTLLSHSCQLRIYFTVASCDLYYVSLLRENIRGHYVLLARN
jgi:hypothetical protein